MLGACAPAATAQAASGCSRRARALQPLAAPAAPACPLHPSNCCSGCSLLLRTPKKVTSIWWHIQFATDPKSILEKEAMIYMAAHPNG